MKVRSAPADRRAGGCDRGPCAHVGSVNDHTGVTDARSRGE
jgi:hypothetical protein